MSLKLNILIQFGLAIILAVIIISLTNLLKTLPIDFGTILTLFYILVVFGQILFYFLTSYCTFLYTIINFILNFIVWVAQQVHLEKTFHDSCLYENEKYSFVIFILSGFLWAFNKIMIDKILKFMKVDLLDTNIIDQVFVKKKYLML